MTDQTDKLRTLNGELCAEINRQEKRIRELESLVWDMWEFGFSSTSGANSIDEYIKHENDIRERIAALGVEVDG